MAKYVIKRLQRLEDGKIVSDYFELTQIDYFGRHKTLDINKQDIEFVKTLINNINL